MSHSSPALRAVIVNHNGGGLLARSVHSVLDAHWNGDKRIVVIDNASSDDSLAAVDGLPGLTIVRNPTNDGFGAANLGFADLIGVVSPSSFAPCERVVLLNPDACVDHETLDALADALDAEGPRVGAAAPHIVFDRPYLDVAVESGDVEIDSITVGDEVVTSSVIPRGSAYRLPGPETPIWLASGGDTLRVPVAGSGPVRLSVRARKPARLAGSAIDGLEVITLDPDRHRAQTIVQNAGSEIGPGGVGHNRGFGDVDGVVEYDRPVPAWCGAAVMFDADYLRDVGGFEPSFFLYYEDIDLAQRGDSRGWSTVYVSGARVEHRHSGMTGQGTRLVEVLQHRNRLITIVRNGGLGTAARAYGRAALTPLSLVATALRDRRARPARLRLAWWRANALLGAMAALPAAVRARRTLRSKRAPRSGPGSG